MTVTHPDYAILAARIAVSNLHKQTKKQFSTVVSDLYHYVNPKNNKLSPMISKKMEYSYKDGADYVFTDPENYETVTLAKELVGDAISYLVENGTVTVTFVEDKAVTVEIPSSVVLTVTDAPEGIRGDSANNVQKPVTLETGITVQVPLFIKTGEKLKIDTRTGKYMERA